MYVGYYFESVTKSKIVMILSIQLQKISFFPGLKTLCTIDRNNPGLLSDKASHRIKGTIIRIGNKDTRLFSSFVVSIVSFKVILSQR